MQRILPQLPTWTKEEADLNDNLSDIYGQLVGQFRRYIGHVTRNIGGVYETFKSVEQPGAVYEITPKEKQKSAAAFLNKQVFTTPRWLLQKDILDKINNPSGGDPVIALQESALSSLLNADRLTRLQACVERFGADKAYNAIELLTDVQGGLFTELLTHKPVDIYRRMLQKSYVDKLAAIINPASVPAPTVTFGEITVNLGGNTSRSDLPAIARGQLVQMRSQLIAAIPLTTDKLSKLHLQDLQEKIKRTLDPK